MIEYEKLLSSGGLSLERLAALCRVAEAGGLSKAAAGDVSRLSLYSRQLKELEVFFGVPLTRRVGRTVALTDTALSLADRVRGHFKELATFREEAGITTPTYTIGSSHSLLEWWVWPRVMKAPVRENPNMQFRAVVMRTAELVRALEASELDVALVRRDAIPRGLRHIPALAYRYALFVPESLVGKGKRVDMAEFARLPLAVTIGGQFRANLQTACDRAGISPTIRLECPSHTLAAGAAASGEYAAILPELAGVAFQGKPVHRHELPFKGIPEREIVLAWNPRLPESRLRAISALLGIPVRAVRPK
jgi:DNA-binding transcriptional LysR family regulator